MASSARASGRGEDEAAHGAGAHGHRADAGQGEGFLHRHLAGAEERGALRSGAGDHVARDHEREAAEHALFGEAGLPRQMLAQQLRHALVIGHPPLPLLAVLVRSPGEAYHAAR
ncbi:hypothetical protein [Pseudoroseicyclus sp. CXY001]|uniref:hypothetical protein n=1 Tax=Pseudoroseicyclus sp. CXY001 TaxID=3242492 RepID=UPI00358DBBF9